MESRCKFWLPKKNRFCANIPLNDSSFCGNHIPRSDGDWIPCPIDPSHSVLKENLQGHVKNCPLLKQVQTLTLQPYYQKGINGGTVEDDVEDNELMPTSEMKRNAVYSMTVSEFSKLIAKIESVHASLCSDIRDSYKIPEACGIWIKGEVDRKLPFQEKHVLQQASILGNLEELGVLKNSYGNLMTEQNECDDNGVPAVIEFGAGRGYLTQMLADCYGIKKVFLVERKSYKLKVSDIFPPKDMTLKAIRGEEDLRKPLGSASNLYDAFEDLNLNAVESLQGVPYVAVGKHLCGPATDLALRCCLREELKHDNAVNCIGTDYLKGLAIATCCHHLCQWKVYINKRYFSNLGLTKDEFHAITWFTSWAVDADHGSDLPDVSACRLRLQSIETKECGEIASGVEEIVRNMKPAERAALGFMCKEIIDMGRFMWVKERGMEAQYVKYVSSNISPENHLLIARRGNHL